MNLNEKKLGIDAIVDEFGFQNAPPFIIDYISILS